MTLVLVPELLELELLELEPESVVVQVTTNFSALTAESIYWYYILAFQPSQLAVPENY